MATFSQLFMVDERNIEWERTKIIPYVRFQVKGEWVEYALGEFFPSTPKRKAISGMVYREIEMYDNSLILVDKKFERTYSIAKGTNYNTAINSLLVEAGIDLRETNIELTDKVLEVTVSYNAGVTFMSAINDLLGRINFVPIYADAKGFFISHEYRDPDREMPVFTFADDEFSILYDGTEEERDFFRVPNRFVLVHTHPEKNTVWRASLLNDDPESPTSTVNVGREITYYQEVQEIESQGELIKMVYRIAREMSQVNGTMSIETALVPNFEIFDILNIRNSYLDVDGNYSLISYTMDLKIGGSMKIKAQKVVSIDVTAE